MLEYKLALEKWGPQAQKMKAVEEMAELIVVLTQHLNGRLFASSEIEDEIADTIIMIEQLKILFPNWKYAFNRKIIRLNEKL